MKIYKDLFNNIISAENLFLAWDEFKKGKINPEDDISFEDSDILKRTTYDSLTFSFFSSSSLVKFKQQRS